MGPNPSIMAQIQAKWPKSGQNLGNGDHNIGLRGQNDVPRARIGVFLPDLGHFAWIWAILLGFGLFGRIWVRIGPKGDEALRMGQGGTDVRMYGRIPPVFYRTSSPLGPLPKKQEIKKARNKKKKESKKES